MTAVVGILNKKGLALAADSAVTRNRNYSTKITNNGNKMVRISDVLPISVMFTGNGSFIGNTWDIVARNYRKNRGNISHHTVEDCMNDFFRYIADSPIFWGSKYSDEWVRDIFISLLSEALSEIPRELKLIDHNGKYTKEKSCHLIKQLRKIKERTLSLGACPQFEDYTIDRFKDEKRDLIDSLFNSIMEDCEDDFDSRYFSFPSKFIDDIREVTTDTLLAVISHRRDCPGSATLIFSGFGAGQEFPSLISACVYEGIEHHINYHVHPKDIICISEKNPVAICPFAQTDVCLSILRGIHPSWKKEVENNMQKYLRSLEDKISSSDDGVDRDIEILSQLENIDLDNMVKKSDNSFRKFLDTNQKEWEKLLEDYDLRSMAALAESLIDLTGFHRVLTFQQEGVGGTVDVAVVSKVDGFTWLNRKSWYHRKDVNGQYGSLGI